MVPENLFSPRKKPLISFKCPMEGGICPLKLLFCNESSVNRVTFLNRSLGNVPRKLRWLSIIFSAQLLVEKRKKEKISQNIDVIIIICVGACCTYQVVSV